MFRRTFVVFASAVFIASGALYAQEVNLSALTIPSGRDISVNFAKTFRAPARSEMQAVVNFDGRQASVKLDYRRMEPAVLFAGDISAYVLWAVTLDGSAENLGEVVADVKNASGTLQGYTGKRTFALMVTAEPFATVTRPTELVLFIAGQAQGPNISNTPFTFKNFTTDYKPALNSIAGIQYNDPTPAAVKQAEMALKIAEKIDAADVNPRAVSGAQAAFAKALAAGRNRKLMADQARIAAQLASQAIKDKFKVIEEREAAELEAKRLAERAALEERAVTAESESERIAMELREVQLQRQALAAETANLAKLMEKQAAEAAAIKRERDEIKKERDDLAGMLKGALSSVAETTETARGVIVSLSGILFDVGQATLMPASQLSVAKLAGILMVFPNMNLSIEGYTDSTGSYDLNMRLSAERARAVYEFLLAQGIAGSRMKYQGFGPENPVAPNDTESNRAKNRRVEVVLTQAVKAP